jgi:hypothetical protein
MIEEGTRRLPTLLLSEKISISVVLRCPCWLVVGGVTSGAGGNDVSLDVRNV